ncbi:hypothetical protein SH668x_000575 [Planctomicrobium sp. SH668]|uniref:hypothetical protein n=1 Tax=Planctomicrobium sp. SH668 TaxID=3448126 RepID=UPI003F5BFE4C
MTILLVGFLGGILYTHKVGPIVGVEILLSSILATPFVVSSVRRNQVFYLVLIFITACAATAVAMFRFPEAKFEAVKSLLSFAASLYCGYILFLVIQGLPRKRVSSVCFWFVLYILGLSVVEVAVPAVREISLEISRTSYASDDFVNWNAIRDEKLHGGLPRPLIGSQEPSWVGISAGLAISGWNMTRANSQYGRFVLIFLVTAAMAIIRSPSLIMVLLAGNSYFILRELRYPKAWNVILAIVLVAGGAVGGYAMKDRVFQVIRGEDGSFNERIRLPFEFMILALKETSGMGLGFIGTPGELGNPALEGVLPIVVEAAENAQAYGTLELFFTREYPITASHFPMLTHWFFHGVFFGAFSLIWWYCFYGSIDRDLVFSFFVSFAVVSCCGYAYESLRLFVTQMFLVGFLVKYRESGYSEVI